MVQHIGDLADRFLDKLMRESERVVEIRTDDESVYLSMDEEMFQKFVQADYGQGRLYRKGIDY